MNMQRVKVILQNNKEFETEVESFDANLLMQEINRTEVLLVAIGSIVVNKHHIECIHQLESNII
jgi:small nuclear ribonucleoprotein (snRNP)-like protein